MNYYNEFDPFAAAWLNKLIDAGQIPQGYVDTRSITEVEPDELKKYTQCHFFAGIGGWSYALQLAGWPTDRPVWTGSCPCQPFSTAGNQKGKSDERHLWPVWFDLIRECRPPVIFGEQVASAVAHGWLDDVYQGLESEGYACGSAVLPACSVGAPHRRDRLWFVADMSSERLPHRGEQSVFRSMQKQEFERCGGNGTLGHTCDDGCPQGGECVTTQECYGTIGNSRTLADSLNAGLQGYAWDGQNGNQSKWINQEQKRSAWEGGIWIDCPDGKQRLVEPSIRLLANGVPNRVGKLRGYGNAIVPQVAAEFIKAYMEITA